IAEFLAMTIFMMIGLSINATVVFRAATQPDAHDLTIAVGWGCALIGGIVMSMGVSGAHLNPALTFSLAVFGHFPWRRVPGMVLAQVLGGFLAAFFTWLLYYPIWDRFSRLTVGERATAGIFIIQPTEPGVYGNGNLVFNEIVYSFSLLYFVFFIADKRMTLSASTGAILAGLFFAATILSGTQYVAVVAMNPARDLGPRLFIWAAGWKDVFTAHNYYFYVPLVGPFIGGVAARGIYD
ncbi:major intrinsic protein, partial [Linderina pennispora]